MPSLFRKKVEGGEKISSIQSSLETSEKLKTDETFSEEQPYLEQVPFVKSEAEKKLVRKLNWTFMPFVCLIIFVQFIDKSLLSIISVIPEFYTDTGIDKDQYGWLGSIFYLGYLCMQLPNNYMLQKFPVSKYLGWVLVFWGISLLCMAFAHNFSQLAALRWLLGLFEAATYPSMFLLIATMYRRSEQVLWFGVLFTSNSFGMILGGVIGAGIMKMPTVGTISPWKWAFLIFGAITILMGCIYFVFLPDTPQSRWFRLTEEEKSIVEERSRDNAVVRSRKINWDQIYEGLRDPKFYSYCLISLFIELQNGALTTFSNIIIASLGYSSFDAVLLSIPSGVVNLILMLGCTQLAFRKGEIIWVAVATTSISLTGLILLAAIPSGGVKLIGLYLCWAASVTYTLMQVSISSNVSGYTKKIFYTSGNLICYTIGNFIGPLLLRQNQAPRYLPAMSVYIAANVIVILLFAYIRYSYTQINKKRNLDKNTNIVALPNDLEDITDVQNPAFVYRT